MWDVKYRPQRFSDVLGQPGTIQVLKARLKNGTAIDTSYIFSGGHGIGKTTLSRILARALLCHDLQEDAEPCNQCDNCQDILAEGSQAFRELDAASSGTIDNVRAMVDDLPFAVQGAVKRIILFDEMHRMSRDSQDVLLKPLEDKRLVGIFCTTEPGKIRATIQSRCEEFTLRPITRDNILARMQTVLSQEKVDFDEDAVRIVIDYSGGHVRDVLNRLEMIAQLGAITQEAVREYLNLSVVSLYYEILLALGDPAKAVTLVDQAVERVGPDAVAAGLAEAAMNSYRLAHQMHADFVYADRQLAAQVYELFKDSVIHLARHFLKDRRVTGPGLICDVALCAGGVPAPTAGAPGPQVVVQALQAPPTPGSQAPAAPTPQQPPPLPAPSKPEESRPTPAAPVAAAPALKLTSLDHKAIPTEKPRGSAPPGNHQAVPRGAKDRALELLTPEEWMSSFEQLLSQNRG